MRLSQEEERERRMDFVPEESAINTLAIEVGNGLTAACFMGGPCTRVGGVRPSASRCGGINEERPS